MTCREEIRLSGATSYPKSCPDCKFGPCKKGYDYGKKPMLNQYGIVVEESYQQDDGYSSYNTVKYQHLHRFSDIEAVKNWLLENNSKAYGSKKVIEVIEYKQLTWKTKVEIDIG